MPNCHLRQIDKLLISQGSHSVGNLIERQSRYIPEYEAQD